MNKFLLHTIIICLALFIFSCAGEASYDMNSNEYEEDTSALNTEVSEPTSLENLKQENLKVYNIRATQKVKDFYDYIKIISDPKVDSDFKSHSLELAKDLFVSDTSTINGIGLNQYLDSISASNTQLIIIPEKTKLATNFTIDSLPNYSAQIKSLLISSQGKQSTTVDVHLIEVVKEFGESKEKTIEVKLGNIY